MAQQNMTLRELLSRVGVCGDIMIRQPIASERGKYRSHIIATYDFVDLYDPIEAIINNISDYLRDEVVNEIHVGKDGYLYIELMPTQDV